MSKFRLQAKDGSVFVSTQARFDPADGSLVVAVYLNEPPVFIADVENVLDDIRLCIVGSKGYFASKSMKIYSANVSSGKKGCEE